ncbi:MAG TPA: hypothetical protein VMT80_00350 [Candidatus Paceibacterota bacterium]|nr:hypothetical protein [Candidatus Paceibacterota bacterium]
METELDDPLMGLFSKLHAFVRDIVDEEYPASAIVLEALRTKEPELAKRAFVETVTAPVRELFAKIGADASAQAALEELESRFRQDSVTQLFYEAQVLAGSRLAWATWCRLEKWNRENEGYPLYDAKGAYTWQAWSYIGWITADVTRAVGRLAGIRERRIQLILAAHIAGKEEVERALAQFSGYKRGALLASLTEQLLCSIEGDSLKNIMSHLAEHGSDEAIEELHARFAGTHDVPRKMIDKIVTEVLTKEEDIEF